MEERLKQRLVGAVVLVALAVVFVPILFDLPGDVNRETSAPPISEIPERPQDRSGSPVRVVTLDPPRTLRLDAEVERERSRSEADGGGASPAAVEAATASAATPEPSEPAASAPRTGPSPARSDPAPPAGTPADGSAERKRAAPAAGGWTVQLGSFARPENARALRKRLRDKGYPAFVESGPSSQGAVSRVFVGPMAERSQAKESAVKLRREMALDGIVVPYPGG